MDPRAACLYRGFRFVCSTAPSVKRREQGKSSIGLELGDAPEALARPPVGTDLGDRARGQSTRATSSAITDGACLTTRSVRPPARARSSFGNPSTQVYAIQRPFGDHAGSTHDVVRRETRRSGPPDGDTVLPAQNQEITVRARSSPCLVRPLTRIAQASVWESLADGAEQIEEV